MEALDVLVERAGTAQKDLDELDQRWLLWFSKPNQRRCPERYSLAYFQIARSGRMPAST